MTRRRLAVLVFVVAACTRQGSKQNAPVAQPPTPRALEGLVLPPAEVGGFSSSVAGCAATPGQEPVATRAALAEEKVEATGVATGMILTHVVPHACCLAATTSVKVVTGTVLITETLDGSPCRCRCSSTLRVAVGLKPGDYAVELKTIESSQSRVAWMGNVRVK